MSDILFLYMSTVPADQPFDQNAEIPDIYARQRDYDNLRRKFSHPNIAYDTAIGFSEQAAFGQSGGRVRPENRVAAMLRSFKHLPLTYISRLEFDDIKDLNAYNDSDDHVWGGLTQVSQRMFNKFVNIIRAKSTADELPQVLTGLDAEQKSMATAIRNGNIFILVKREKYAAYAGEEF